MGSLKRQVSVATLVVGAFTHSVALAQTKPATRAQTVTSANDPSPPSAGGDAALSDDAELARVVSLVEAAKYDQCAE